MSRFRAFLIHLSISATVVGVVFAVIFFFWYPNPYFRLSGTGEVVMVLIGVDLVLGPMLTLMLFKSGKPGMLIDLSIIAAVQIAALVYGANAIFQERPYFVVFAIDRFVVMPKKEIDFDQIVIRELKEKPWRGPIFVYADPPESDEEKSRLLMEVLDGKPDIERRPEYWSLYADKIDRVMSRADAFGNVRARTPEAREILNEARQRHANAERLLYLPIIAKTNVYSVLLDPDTKEPVDFIEIDPWTQLTAGSDESNAG